MVLGRVCSCGVKRNKRLCDAAAHPHSGQQNPSSGRPSFSDDEFPVRLIKFNVLVIAHSSIPHSCASLALLCPVFSSHLLVQVCEMCEAGGYSCGT